MFSNLSTKRPSLGQIAELGDLYDARTDSFLSLSTLKASPPPSTLNRIDNLSRELEFTNNDTYAEKFNKMKLNAELGASFLSGLVSVNGSGRYLSETRTSSRIMQVSCLYNITTVREKLNFTAFTDPVLKSHLNLNVIQSGIGTHVVSEIEWGANSVVNARYKVADRTNQSEVQGILDAGLAGLKSIVNTEGEFERAQKNSQTSFEIRVNGDLVAGEDMPTDFESAIQFIKKMPSRISASNGGKGKPLVYTLLPLGMLHFIYDLELKHHTSLKQLSVECLEQFVHLFDEWCDVRQKLNDYFADVTSHEFCLPNQHLLDTFERLNQAKAGEVKLKESYGKVLPDVRSGLADQQCLWELLNRSRSAELSPQKMLSTTLKYRAKMSFADSVLAKGADSYIGYDRTKLDQISMEKKTEDTYILYFNDSVTGQSPLWEENRRLVLDLLDSKRAEYQVIICDCDLGNYHIEKPYIELHRGGKVIVPDLYQEYLCLSDKCIIRYDQSTERYVQPPFQRRSLKVPCPGRHCSSSPGYNWTCGSCKQPVEYGYTDNYLYCNCGRVFYEHCLFKCKDNRHGLSFERYDHNVLLQLLQKLEPFEEVNVLILGETGVGKSTFINAFINYLTYETLAEAMDANRLEQVVPSSFSYQFEDENGEFKQQDIVIGSSPNEGDGTTGESATQKTTVYRIPLPLDGDNTILRLIDTPGIGDTRGAHQDMINMEDILSTLRHIDKLHAILILLKPTNSRLALTFRFCVTELLVHLDRDAVHNIVFGFTNTRSSFYTPGDTYKPLQSLLKNVEISLSKHNVYCFDSESFRFLAALHVTGKAMDGLKDFENSWDRSVVESKRLLAHCRTLLGHTVKRTLNLNRARNLITGLTKPMAETTAVIERTITKNEELKQKLEETELTGKDLRASLYFDTITLERVDLDKPRTVCSDATCSTNRLDAIGRKVVVYKSICHNNCYLRPEVERIGDPALAGCAAFGCGAWAHCTKCKHHWNKHLHIVYELHDKATKSIDPKVQKRLADSESDYSIQKQAVESLQLLIEQRRAEKQQLRNASIRFGLYLKRNSITAYNDHMLAYLDSQIKEEKRVISDTSCDSSKLDSLQNTRNEYAEQIQAIENSMNNQGNIEMPTEDGIESIVQDLYHLEEWGKNLKEIATGKPDSHYSYEERSYGGHLRRTLKRHATKFVTKTTTFIMNSMGSGSRGKTLQTFKFGVVYRQLMPFVDLDLLNIGTRN